MCEPRWNCQTDKDEDTPKIDAFLVDVLQVCSKHGFSISHEDSHGGFIITKFNKEDNEHLNYASFDFHV